MKAIQEKNVKFFIKRYKEIFEEKLKAKTGWGKNEILVICNESIIDALSELLEKLEN